MDGTSILSLPPELLDHIASNLRLVTHLKNLALVCKQLNEVAIPRLYHTVELDVTGSAEILDEEDAGFLTVGNPGHRHIRHLIFYPDGAYDFEEPYPEHCTSRIKRVLHVLPWHKLETFITPQPMGIDGATFSMLCAQQNALRVLSIGPLAARLPPTVSWVKTAFQNLTDFSMPNNGTDHDLELCGSVIALCPQLAHLTVVLPAMPLLDPTRSREAHEKLLGSLETKESQQMTLKSLQLARVNLDDEFSLWWTSSIRFEHLKFLKLINCPNVDQLLQSLARRFGKTQPDLRGLQLSITRSRRDITALETFLQSFSGLEYLKVESDYADDFHASSIASHVGTLRDLYLGLRREFHEGHWSMSHEAASEFFSRHRKLRQVGIALQPMPNRTQSGYTVGSKAQQWEHVTQCAETLKNLTNLEVLRILSPEDSLCPSDVHDFGDDVPRRKDEFATRFISHLTSSGCHPKLKLLCLGAGPDCACYYPGYQRDCFGNEQVAALYTPAHRVKYDLPWWNPIHYFGPEVPARDGGLGLGDYEQSMVV